jgi:hypothetical protein
MQYQREWDSVLTFWTGSPVNSYFKLPQMQPPVVIFVQMFFQVFVN